MDCTIRLERGPLNLILGSAIANYTQRLNSCSSMTSLVHLEPALAEDILKLSVDRISCLQHELSEHFQRRSHGRLIPTRSKAEAKALAEWTETEPCSSGPSFDAFLSQLEDLNGILTTRSSRRRSDSIGTAPDRLGVTVVFPAIEKVVPQLRWLMRQIHGPENERLPAVLVATAALVILTNAHLFTDGNGRLSRAVFNHVLHRNGMPADVYIPVYEFALRSRGGFLIRVRQAELRGEWEPLIEFVLNMLQICADMRTNPAARSGASEAP